MNKIKDPKISMKIGGALREMTYSLKYGEKSPVIPYRSLPLSPETIEKGRKIIERMKAKLHTKQEIVMVEKDTMAKHNEDLVAYGYPCDYADIKNLEGKRIRIRIVEKDTKDIRTAYPLKRDPKTGRIMKAGVE